MPFGQLKKPACAPAFRNIEESAARRRGFRGRQAGAVVDQSCDVRLPIAAPGELEAVQVPGTKLIHLAGKNDRAAIEQHDLLAEPFDVAQEVRTQKHALT